MSKPDWDIVMLALPRWDGPYSSTAWSLARELSVHTRVFYIDNPFTYKDYFTNRHSDQIRKREKALRQGADLFTTPDSKYPNLVAVTPQLVWPINWLPPGALYNFFSRENDRIVLKAIKKMIDTYHLKKFVFINSFNPLVGRHFARALKPECIAYHCVDDISKSEYVSRHGTRLESEVVRNADFTIVTSLELKRLKSAYTQKVFYLPNAADVELFQQSLHTIFDRPPELKQTEHGRKIICYMGNICHRLDYELLRSIAEGNKDNVLLMVGPLSNDNYKKSGLNTLPNVIFTGSKKLEQLPAYLQHSHCCIIPFLCIPLTRSIYPLKINEYLSAGKPVVTTNFSEDIARFKDVAYVSSTHEEFLHNINKAMEDDSEQLVKKRVDFSAGNNWRSRAWQLIEIIESNLNHSKNERDGKPVLQ